jgi:hypothetical protein
MLPLVILIGGFGPEWLRLISTPAGEIPKPSATVATPR